MLRTKFVACALALAMALAGQTARAAQLSMSGFVTGPTDVNTPFSFVLDYIPSAATAVAAVNGGTLTLGSQVWNTVLGGTGASISAVTASGQTKANSLQVAVQFAGPSSPGPSTGTAVTFLSFTITGPGLDSSASLANITNIRSFATNASGTLFISPAAPLPDPIKPSKPTSITFLQRNLQLQAYLRGSDRFQCVVFSSKGTTKLYRPSYATIGRTYNLLKDNGLNRRLLQNL